MLFLALNPCTLDFFDKTLKNYTKESMIVKHIQGEITRITHDVNAYTCHV